MLQELLGTAVSLASCRLDGSDCCRFAVDADSEAVGDAGEA
jgi:hypothetical protein